MLKTTRNRKGQLALEVAATCVFLLVFILLSVDLGFLLYGANINDKACRDACRAPAQLANAAALQRANAALRAQRLAGDTIGQSIVTRPVIPGGGLIYDDYGGAVHAGMGGLLPANRTPFVTVTTQCTSTLPFAPPQLLGNTLPGTFTFRQTYTFPIVQVN